MLVPLLISLGSLAFLDWTSLSGGSAESHVDSVYALSIALCEGIILTAAAGLAAFQLDAAATKTASPHQRVRPWMPLLSIAVFAFIVFFTRLAGWLPVEFGALIAFPCIVLPPLTYRVIRHPERSHSPKFNLEETCRVLDSAKGSSLIGEFLERYPNTKVYLYRNPQSHSAGGLLFHNREYLTVPLPTHLEVTLNCPFTSRLGVFAEGRVTFRAYLNRSHPRGSILHTLPPKTWEDWLVGLTRKEWFDRFSALDETPPNFANTNGLPCQFLENDWTWEMIDLT